VARDRAAPAEALRDGPAAGVADARDHQRHLLCHAGGLPVAPATEGLAAMGDDLPDSQEMPVESALVADGRSVLAARRLVLPLAVLWSLSARSR
jgi:hypothetical protein